MTRRHVVIAFVAGVKLGAGVVGLVVMACREHAAAAAPSRDEARRAELAEMAQERDHAFALAERWRSLAEPDASCAADLVEARQLATECAQFGLGGEQ